MILYGVQIFPVAKRLADCVVPAEYGISPDYKLRIGKKIASELIGKLLADLDNSRRDCDAESQEATVLQQPITPSESSIVHASGDEINNQVCHVPKLRFTVKPSTCIW